MYHGQSCIHLIAVLPIHLGVLSFFVLLAEHQPGPTISASFPATRFKGLQQGIYFLYHLSRHPVRQRQPQSAQPPSGISSHRCDLIGPHPTFVFFRFPALSVCRKQQNVPNPFSVLVFEKRITVVFVPHLRICYQKAAELVD